MWSDDVKAEQDTDEAAMRGKLGQSEPEVQEAFRRLDHLVHATVGKVDRRAVRLKGEWSGRSYVIERSLLIRIDPKVASLRVRVDADAYSAASKVLTGSYQQDDWLIVRPRDLDTALTFIEGFLRQRVQEITR